VIAVRRVGLLIAGLGLLIASLNSACTVSANNPTVDQAVTTASQIVFVGDILVGDAAQQTVETRGFEWPFQQVRDLLKGAYVVGNAEGPITTRSTSYFPDAQWSYNASPQSADALATVGINAVSLANNHAFDRGPDGLVDTVGQLQRVGIQTFGAGMSLDEASRPLLIPTPHGTVAVLGFSEGGAQRPAAGPGQFGLNQLEPKMLSKYRAQAVDAGARWVVAFVHWGANYVPIRASQQRAAQAFSQAGFDMVIGHHPHVVQPVERVGEMPVVYSLGNFVFGSGGRFTRAFPGYGLVARSLVDKDGMTLELSCIVTDNKLVTFQPRPCSEPEARAVIEGLGPSVTWSDGKGLLRVK
jgi:poly-gamma-glutamate capsule biosynthesis protein CapA/YwtB (metallophosphatase superfamily)